MHPADEGREDPYDHDATSGCATAPRPASASSPARERAIQFFEPLIDFRPSRLFGGDVRRRFRLLQLEPLDFGRRSRQILLNDRQLALNR